MANKLELERELVDLGGLQTLVVTYQEIAATRMRKVKSFVLNNRDYSAELNEVYQQVMHSYRGEVRSLLRKKGKSRGKKENTSRSVLNDRTVSILLSSNTMLYGDIIKKTFELFMETVREGDADIVIVGKTGLGMFKNTGMKNDYMYYDLSDNIFNTESTLEVVRHALQYSKIYVFHGKFKTVMSQVAEKSVISGDLLEMKGDDFEDTRYIFEPSLEKILEYFESEILMSFFEQAVHESYLSKFAARMVNLESAVEEIGGRLKTTEFRYNRLKHRIQDTKQLESISGIALWS